MKRFVATFRRIPLTFIVLWFVAVPVVCAGAMTLGSTKKEVLSDLGIPTSDHGDVWFYGISTIDFDNNGRVAGFSQVDRDLKIRMTPASGATGVSNLSLGSTKDEVLSVLGTPTSVHGKQWSYGISTIDFDNNGMITAFSQVDRDLKIRMTPATGATGVSNLTLGSTKDEVLSVLGTPTSVHGKQWNYGISTIDFDNNGMIAAFSQIDRDLKIRMTPVSGATGVSNLSLGSTKDEVLSILGTPTNVYGKQWRYSLSTIDFDNNGVVVAFSQIDRDLHISGASKAQSKASKPAPTSSPPSTSSTQSSVRVPSVNEKDSHYRELSPRTGRPKTVHVNGYYRKDGTYVKGHYRSSPRR